MPLAHLTGKYPDKGAPVPYKTLSAYEKDEDTDLSLLSKIQLTKENKQRLKDWNTQLTKQAISARVTPDVHLVHMIHAIEELDKVSNTLSKRLRDWYATYNPELEHTHPDHKDFVQEVLMMSQPDKNTMGGTLSDSEFAAITTQATAVSQLHAQREFLLEKLEKSMKEICPNLHAVAGAMIGAKLLSLGRGLERLSRLPSGTIQLLGAETALFRHLRNRSARPPKHGILFNHQLLQRAPRKMHGKIARALADSIAIAVKVDHFKGEFCGDTLLKKVEAKL